MDNGESGFTVDGRAIPWGTLLADAMLIDGLECVRDRSAQAGETTFACDHAYGLRTVVAIADAPSRDRPITGVSYELAVDDEGRFPTREWLATIEASFGRPVAVEHQDLSDHADPSGGVALWARWQGRDISAGLSVYGGLRSTPRGVSGAMFWLSWNEELAARPFLAEWIGRTANLAAVASEPEVLRLFHLDLEQNALFASPDGQRLGQSDTEDRRRFSRLALRCPEILATPPALARRLDGTGFALWRTDSGTWGASTKADTICLVAGESVAVDHVELKPAKGGGIVRLDIGRWGVHACYPSRAIAEAARWLASLPGVRVSHHEGYDC